MLSVTNTTPLNKLTVKLVDTIFVLPILHRGRDHIKLCTFTSTSIQKLMTFGYPFSIERRVHNKVAALTICDQCRSGVHCSWVSKCSSSSTDKLPSMSTVKVHRSQ